MSALDQKRTSNCRPLMSALPPKADTVRHSGNVRFVPIADIADPISGYRAIAIVERCLFKG